MIQSYMSVYDTSEVGSLLVRNLVILLFVINLNLLHHNRQNIGKQIAQPHDVEHWKSEGTRLLVQTRKLKKSKSTSSPPFYP